MVKLQNKTDENIRTRMIESISAGKEKMFKWLTIKPGDIVEAESADEKQLLKKGLSLVQEKEENIILHEIKQDKKDKSEIKSVDSFDFSEELQKIKGIGKKTAKDIMAVYATKEELLKAIEMKEHIPVEDSIEELLYEQYNKKTE